MAVEEANVEYESDPEDTLYVSTMRRREASDDEDDEGSQGQEEPKLVGKGRPGMRSEDELEGQGEAPGYDDEYDRHGEEEDEVELLEEEVEAEGLVEDDAEIEERPSHEPGHGQNEDAVHSSVHLPEESSNRPGGEKGVHETAEVEKKENEPYAVPTAGAFYMHDDRFQENGRGRQRRMPGGRWLWESKDEHAWVHDRFEEMSLQDRRYEERRVSKGRFQIRGSRRNNGGASGYGRGYVPQTNYADMKNEIHNPKFVRGRGPRRYRPPYKNNEISMNQPKQSSKSSEVTSANNTRKNISLTSNAHPEPAGPCRQVLASNLSSASPPFYPSSSSNQDISSLQKHDMTIETNRKPLPSTVRTENKFPTSSSNSFFTKKSALNSNGLERFYLDDSAYQAPGKQLLNSQLQTPVSFQALSNANQSSQNQVQARNSSYSTPDSLPNSSFNQGARIPMQEPPAVQHKSFQVQGQPAPRISTQHLTQNLVMANQVPSIMSHTPGNSFGGGEVDSPPGSSKSKTSLVGKEKPTNQGAGKSTLLYGGAQVFGQTWGAGLPPVGENFPGTPALMPVMQFGGQHPGGLGVSAVGMALPGYVAQPQIGFQNSEMNWVPVLAGASGALSASYCSPYIAFDGGYYAHASGQTFAPVSSSKESEDKHANTHKLPKKPELMNDEVGQRQNKPRRYSEMNFSQ